AMRGPFEAREDRLDIGRDAATVLHALRQALEPQPLVAGHADGRLRVTLGDEADGVARETVAAVDFALAGGAAAIDFQRIITHSALPSGTRCAFPVPASPRLRRGTGLI